MNDISLATRRHRWLLDLLIMAPLAGITAWLSLVVSRVPGGVAALRVNNGVRGGWRLSRRTGLLRLLHLVVAVATLLALSACASVPRKDPLVVGRQATIEGDVVGVDTNPWAYDGNAVVTISTTGAGTVSVQLPARWNLCKAQSPGDVQALKPRDRVQAVGMVTAPGEMVVCAQAEHRLRKVE